MINIEEGLLYFVDMFIEDSAYSPQEFRDLIIKLMPHTKTIEPIEHLCETILAAQEENSNKIYLFRERKEDEAKLNKQPRGDIAAFTASNPDREIVGRLYSEIYEIW